MPTLMLSDRSLRGAPALAAAAKLARWSTSAIDEPKAKNSPRPIVYYGTTDLALETAHRFQLALIEPPLDMLTRLPQEFLRRSVESAAFGDLDRLLGPTFIKPANPLAKDFDAGIYTSVQEIRKSRRVQDATPVLLAEPVEWSSEYRCFIREGRFEAWSPYITFGRLSWEPFAPGKIDRDPPAPVRSLCERLLAQQGAALPPAFVVDIGLIDDRGWAVVEFNPVWCAGVLGADPSRVLPVLERSCRDLHSVSLEDQKWLVERRLDERD